MRYGELREEKEPLRVFRHMATHMEASSLICEGKNQAVQKSIKPSTCLNFLKMYSSKLQCVTNMLTERDASKTRLEVMQPRGKWGLEN